MRSTKQIAMDIFNGDSHTLKELEKMIGKSLNEMTDEEKSLGLSILSAFDGKWWFTMDKLDVENVSLQAIAQKVNKIVDALNFDNQWHFEELEKQRNEMTYGKYISNEDAIKDMKSRIKFLEKEGKIIQNLSLVKGGEP